MTKKRKQRNKKTKKIFIFILIIVIGFILVFVLHEEHLKRLEKEEVELIENIKSKYAKNVKVNKKTNLYDKNGKVMGTINKDVELVLDDVEVSKDTKYFKIITIEDSYIKYNDVDKIDSIKLSSRYKNYIPFNKNIVTKDKTTFYDENDKFLYTINKSYDVPIIINDTTSYGVEFNNQLLYIHKDDVVKEYDNKNTELHNSSGVAVLNYHAFYDENDSEARKNCTTEICHSKKQFKTHLEYFKKNKIFTVTMDELEKYMDGKLQLPKSLLITIDDGPKTEVAVDLLTEYKMNATIFLVTSWFDEEKYYKTDYIELHSHSHNMHDGGECPGGQGGAIKCWPEDKILADLKQSREDLNGSIAFCYPFYEHNNYSEQMLKKAGFRMAFIGEVPFKGGYKLATVGGDKFKIPRFVIVTYTTLNDFDRYFNQIH